MGIAKELARMVAAHAARSSPNNRRPNHQRLAQVSQTASTEGSRKANSLSPRTLKLIATVQKCRGGLRWICAHWEWGLTQSPEASIVAQSPHRRLRRRPKAKCHG